jgi:phage-related holin
MVRVWLMKLGEKLIHLPELLIIYFAPAGGQLFVVAMAVLCDTATGVWAARKADEKISSRRLADIFPKLLVYFLLILLAHTIENVFKIDFGFSVRSIVSLAILGNELMSIDENLKKATGKGVFQKVVEAIKRK